MASVPKLLQIVCFLTTVGYVQSELYTSLIHLETLVKTQKYVIDNIENYVRSERQRIYVIRRLIRHFKEEYENAKENLTHYLGNPINAYTLIKRQTADLSLMQKKIKEKTRYISLRNRNRTLKNVKKLTFPTRKDVDGALQALARLQRTYQMNVTDFASGKMFGNSSGSLKSSDCYKIGGLEYKDGNFNETILWMLESIKNYKLEHEKKSPFTELDIMEYISYAYLSLDDIENALLWNDKLKLAPTNPRYIGRALLLQKHRDMMAKTEYDKKQIERNENSTKNNPSIRVLREQLLKTFTKLCRRDGSLPNDVVRRLKCRYLTEHHPFLRLAPLKMEQLYIEPDVIMFHRVMSDAEIDHITKLARPLLRPAGNQTSEKSKISQLSVSKNAWFQDEDSEVVARVSRRVSDMTGLGVEVADRLQVANYGIGGYDEPRYDYLKMSDVYRGGATVFPKLGLRVTPVKGAAIYWQYGMPSGKRDVFARHASCPVLFGSKWDPLPRTQTMELFTSLIEMEPLVKTHKSVLDNLENYLSDEKKRLNVLRKYLKQFKDEHNKAMENIPNYLENPINSYMLIKRLTTDLDFLERKIREKTEYRRVTNMKFPAQKDLDGALEAIVRLQRTYQMNVTEFASGVPFGSSSNNFSSSLTSYDCYLLGALEHKEQHYNETITWMTEAVDRYKLEPFQLYNITEVDIIEFIVYAYLSLDDVNSALEWNDKLDLDTTDPRYVSREQLLQRHRDMQARNEYENKVAKNQYHLKKMDMFAKLCRGEVNLPADFVKRLKCRYLTEHHAFLRLAPLKMEQLYIEPDVIMLHEVMSDAVIQRLKSLAKPLLHRGEIRNVSTGQTFGSDNRIVQVAWLTDHESYMVEEVSRRVSDMTGLSSASAEFLQVANYGIGGFYEPHHDVVLVQMTNVERGGATVFLNLGLTVVPVKGSALIWNNLHSSGDVDLATYHGACPVLHGTKWIATKWLHQRGQELIRPCDVTLQDAFAIPKHHYQWWI